MISNELNVSCLKVSASVIGSHGESMMPLPRFTIVNGKHLPDVCDKAKIDELVQKTVDRGKEIVSLLEAAAHILRRLRRYPASKDHHKRREKDIRGFLPFNGEYGVKAYAPACLVSSAKTA